MIFGGATSQKKDGPKFEAYFLGCAPDSAVFSDKQPRFVTVTYLTYLLPDDDGPTKVAPPQASMLVVGRTDQYVDGVVPPFWAYVDDLIEETVINPGPRDGCSQELIDALESDAEWSTLWAPNRHRDVFAVFDQEGNHAYVCPKTNNPEGWDDLDVGAGTLAPLHSIVGTLSPDDVVAAIANTFATKLSVLDKWIPTVTIAPAIIREVCAKMALGPHYPAAKSAEAGKQAADSLHRLSLAVEKTAPKKKGRAS